MGGSKVRHVRTVNKLRLYRRDAPDDGDGEMLLPSVADGVENVDDFAMSAAPLNLGYQRSSDVVTKLVLGGDE